MRFLPWPLLLIATALALVAIATAASATDIPGDYIIGDHQTVTSDTLNVYGDIVVSPGGWLELVDTDVVLMGTTDGEYTVYVEAGGKLTMDGGSISADNASYRYKMEIQGTATLEGVTVTDTWGQGQAFDATSGDIPTLSNLKGGIQIYSSTVYIGNSSLYRGMLCMVYVGNGATPTLYGNIIHNVTYDVRAFSQNVSNPSTTRWSAMA